MRVGTPVAPRAAAGRRDRLRRRRVLLPCAIVLGSFTAAAAAPFIDAVTPSVVPLSDRFMISGSGFGDNRGTGRVRLGQMDAMVTRWSDTRIAAYVPRDAVLGVNSVQVITDAGEASNEVQIEVAPREPGAGRVLWRFRADALSILHRPAVGPDGTVYVADGGGFLYALDPEGGLKWIYDSEGAGDEGPVAVGGDGTIYVSSNPLGPDLNLHAVNPDGSRKWVFTDSGQETIAGPGVGPDGNIYVVNDIGGLGAFSLTPEGTLRWNETGFADFGTSGTEIAFADPEHFFFCDSGFLEAFRLGGNHRWQRDVGSQTKQVATGPESEGSIYVEAFVTGAGTRLQAYDLNGNLKWTHFGIGTNVLSAPDVGSDGTVYIVRNTRELHAIAPDGSTLWTHTDTDNFGPATTSESPYRGPVVGPVDVNLAMGGTLEGTTTGIIRAFAAADGQPLWTVELPVEHGGNVRPASRPRFAPHGRTIYVGTNIPGQGEDDPFSFLYAIAFDAPEPVTRLIFETRTRFVWDAAAGASVYDVARGDLETMRLSGSVADATCQGEDIAALTWTDTATPAPGAGFFYLIRGDDPSMPAGTYDNPVGIASADENRDFETGSGECMR